MKQSQPLVAKQKPLFSLAWIVGCMTILGTGACVTPGLPTTPLNNSVTASNKAPTPLTVGRHGAPAPWLEPPCQGKACPFPEPTKGQLAAFNADVSVIATDAGQYLTATRGGIIRPMAKPTPTKPSIKSVGVLDGGRLIALTTDGRIWSAASPEAAVARSGWQTVPNAQLARAASTSGSWIAYLRKRDGRLFVARWPTDASSPTRFRSSKPPQAAKAASVAVRSDGLVMVRAKPKLGPDGLRMRTFSYIRRAASRRWDRSQLPLWTVRSSGDWLWNGREDCPVVLSSNGRQWLDLRKDWDALLSLNQVRVRWFWMARAQSRLYFSITSDAPADFQAAAANTLAHRHVRAAASTRCPQRHTPVTLGLYKRMCFGALCLRGTTGAAPKETPLAAGLLGNAVCRDGRGALSSCSQEASITRSPTLVVGSRKTGQLRFSELPVGCRSPKRTDIHLDSIGGLAVLRCPGTAAPIGSAIRKIYTAAANVNAKTRWHYEGTMAAISGGTVTMAADGTVMVHEKCPKDSGVLFSAKIRKAMGIEPVVPKPPTQTRCRAWVRMPLAAGAPDAWRGLNIADASAYRVGPGGHALAIHVTRDAPNRIGLTSVAPDGRQSLLMVRTSGPIATLEVDRQGFAWLGTSSAPSNATEGPVLRHNIFTDGSVLPKLPSVHTYLQK